MTSLDTATPTTTTTAALTRTRPRIIAVAIAVAVVANTVLWLAGLAAGGDFRFTDNGVEQIAAPGGALIFTALPMLAGLTVAALLGYRLVILDMEPGFITQNNCDALVGLARCSGLTVILRVAVPERILVQQGLDHGADGVMLPMVGDAAHAAEVSAHAKNMHRSARGVWVRGEPLPMALTPQSMKRSFRKRMNGPGAMS
jgi:hypothetical protein